MKVLVTGAGGFCGKHLTAYLQSQEVEIFTLGRTPTIFHHYKVCPTDLAGVTQALKASRPNYVFHLAGVAVSPEAATYYQVNTAYAACLLQALEEAGLANVPVLLVGSSAEYGMVTESELPITENLPAKPYSHYGISKLTQTNLGLAAASQGRPIVL